MNIHPVLVHFPIALLSIYSLMEFLQFKKLDNWGPWFYIKFFFIFFGFFGALLALYTGGFGRELYPAERNLIRLHETFGKGTVIIFGLLGIRYGIELVRRVNWNLFSLSHFPELERMALAVNKLYVKPILVILALGGLIALIITGALGGSIVYGANSDPVIRLVYKLLGL